MKVYNINSSNSPVEIKVAEKDLLDYFKNGHRRKTEEIKKSLQTGKEFEPIVSRKPGYKTVSER